MVKFTHAVIGRTFAKVTGAPTISPKYNNQI